MQELRRRDVERIVNGLPENVRLFLEEHDVYLAGGFIRDVLANKRPHDIDIFGPERELADFDMAAELTITPWAKTFTQSGDRLPIQLVTGFPVSDPYTLLDRFNFTVNQAAIWRSGLTQQWMSLCSDDFYQDLAARQLVFTCTQTPAGAAKTLEKMLVFVSEGWAISLEETMKVVATAVLSTSLPSDIGELTAELLRNARGEEDYAWTTKESIAQVARSNSSARGSFTTLREQAVMAYTF
jgi:hypothetical protein